MRFKCGETEAERRARVARLEDWHDYFALLPREVGDGECRWLETIQRSGCWVPAGYSHNGFWLYTYRAKP